MIFLNRIIFVFVFGDFFKSNNIRIRVIFQTHIIHGNFSIQIIFVIILIFVVLSFFGGTSYALFDGTNLLNGLVEENRINANNATVP